MGASSYSRRWLTAAIVLSAVFVLSAPFMGQLRTAVRQAAGGNFALLMAAVVGGGAALLTLYALRRIRSRYAMRYAAVVAALAIGAGYAYLARTGNSDVDAVERVHFIEYGLITILFYRAWKPAGDGSALIMPVLAGLIVGTCEEWLQWFIPARVGEVRDVLLNLVAVGCGLLFGLGIGPPPRLSLAISPVSRRRVAVLTAIVLVVFGGFFHSVHLGHEIKDAEAGVFRSRYTAAQLAQISADRTRRWATNPPLTWSRYSREDQYFSEGVAHVQRRNEMWNEGNVMSARHENLILEKYYAPVLDTPSYVSAHGHRWPAAQRADAESSIGPGFMIYMSDAEEAPILLWPKWAFWLLIVVLVGLLLRQARGGRRAGA
jgi:hypothetical protein